MQLTHRRWTDDLIEEEIKSVVSSLGYFPSNNDLIDMGNGGLSGAIQKSGGFVSWQNKLGLNPKVKRMQWTEEEISSQLCSLAKTLGHFPSVSEMKRLGFGTLESAIGKHGGVIAWSDKLGIPRIHSDSDTGWDGEAAIKSLLETKDFNVIKSKAVKCPYDLLVNNKVRCDVKTASEATYSLNNGKDYSAWFYRIGKAVQSDIVILYRKDVGDCFVLPWWEVGKTNITISPESPKYSKYKNRFDIITAFDQSIQNLRDQFNAP